MVLLRDEELLTVFPKTHGLLLRLLDLRVVDGPLVHVALIWLGAGRERHLEYAGLLDVLDDLALGVDVNLLDGHLVLDNLTRLLLDNLSLEDLALLENLRWLLEDLTWLLDGLWLLLEDLAGLLLDLELAELSLLNHLISNHLLLREYVGRLLRVNHADRTPLLLKLRSGLLNSWYHTWLQNILLKLRLQLLIDILLLLNSRGH